MTIQDLATTLDELRKPTAIAQYHAVDNASTGICQSIHQLSVVIERSRMTAIAIHDDRIETELNLSGPLPKK